MTDPAFSEGTSHWTRSNGSLRTPSISRKITCGLDTWSSNPSRLIFSIKIDKCNSPRPATTHVSGESVGVTFNETSVSSCWSKRSWIWRAVT